MGVPAIASADREREPHDEVAAGCEPGASPLAESDRGRDGVSRAHREPEAADEPPAACAAIGAGLAGSARRVALLVMADGSARHGLKAPGHLDERSAPFDERVERAVATGNVSDLLDIDPDLAGELMARMRAIPGFDSDLLLDAVSARCGQVEPLWPPRAVASTRR